MARNIPNLPFHHHIAFLPPWLTLFMAAFVAIISVFSMITFLCGSHKEKESKRHGQERKTERLGGDQRVISRLQSNISSKALLISKMISWRKVQDEAELEQILDDDEAIWKKTIIKGEKCRPLNFSGKILYDSDGNRLPDSPHSTLLE